MSCETLPMSTHNTINMHQMKTQISLSIYQPDKNPVSFSFNSHFHRPSVLFPNFFCYSSHMHLYHMSKSVNQNWSWDHEVSIKIPQAIQFCKHMVLCVLHIKYELVIKGYLAPFCRLLLLRKNNFYVFQTAFVVAYFLTSAYNALTYFTKLM